MTYSPSIPSKATGNQALRLITRKPKRVSITVSQGVLDRLQHISDEQGRSTSNLAAYLLETALDALEGRPNPIPKRFGPKTT